MNLSGLSQNLTRRDFLKFLSLGFISSVLPVQGLDTLFAADNLLGRVTINGVSLYKSPSYKADKVGDLYLDTVKPITKITIGDEEPAGNRLWYQLDGYGYAHSGHIQPVKRQFQASHEEIPSDGRVAEVTVPYVDAYTKMNGTRKAYRLYYSSMFWVLSRERDERGIAWYKLLDDRTYAIYYVRALYMRLIPYKELLPISSEVDPQDKWILVDLEEQTLTAFEREQSVFMARISSGVRTKEGGFATPRGYFRTTLKRPCRHMATGPSDFGSGFDLPGVPWVSYFTGDGRALHGAYWHNNFGIPQSHGCINMAPRAARWVYLWTFPSVPKDRYYYSELEGTLVKIV